MALSNVMHTLSSVANNKLISPRKREEGREDNILYFVEDSRLNIATLYKMQVGIYHSCPIWLVCACCSVCALLLSTGNCTISGAINCERQKEANMFLSLFGG